MKINNWKQENLDAIGRKIITILLKEPHIVCSWNFKKPKVAFYNNMPGIKFKIEGTFHRSEVFILFNIKEDFYEIIIQCFDGQTRQNIKRVFDHHLVSVVDKAVEICEYTDENYNIINKDNQRRE